MLPVHILQNMSLYLKKCSMHNPSDYNPSSQHRHVSHQNQIAQTTPGCIYTVVINRDKLVAVCKIQGVCIKNRRGSNFKNPLKMSFPAPETEVTKTRCEIWHLNNTSYFAANLEALKFVLILH